MSPTSNFAFRYGQARTDTAIDDLTAALLNTTLNPQQAIDDVKKQTEWAMFAKACHVYHDSTLPKADLNPGITRKELHTAGTDNTATALGDVQHQSKRFKMFYDEHKEA